MLISNDDKGTLILYITGFLSLITYMVSLFIYG